jgi:hypothetical protein
VKGLVLLVATPLLLWGALIYPGWLLWGDRAIRESAVALGLCLVPAIVSYLLSLRWANTPDKQVVAVLGGSGLRMALALGGGFLLYHRLPDWFSATFWVWMGLFYLSILALETALVLRNKQNNPAAG